MTADSLILRSIGIIRAKAKLGFRNLASNIQRLWDACVYSENLE